MYQNIIVKKDKVFSSLDDSEAASNDNTAADSSSVLSPDNKKQFKKNYKAFTNAINEVADDLAHLPSTAVQQVFNRNSKIQHQMLSRGLYPMSQFRIDKDIFHSALINYPLLKICFKSGLFEPK